jgi:hypothetical protein
VAAAPARDDLRRSGAHAARLGGLAMTNNGSEQSTWLRAILILVSLIGVVAAALLNGMPVDPNVVSNDVTLFIQTGVLAYFAHAFYNSAFRT